jgi:hypothetical protein
MAGIYEPRDLGDWIKLGVQRRPLLYGRVLPHNSSTRCSSTYSTITAPC